MKISTILMGAALAICGTTAFAAEENLMRGAVDGAPGRVAGMDAPLVVDGWQLWKCPYKTTTAYDEEDMPYEVYSFDTKAYREALLEFEYDDETIDEMLAELEPENITENWPDGVRIETAPGSWKFNLESSEGEDFIGNVAFFRWDGVAPKTSWFCYPVELKKGWYTFSCLGGEFNNFSANDSKGAYVFVKGMRVTISKEVGPTHLVYAKEYDEEEAEKQAGVVAENYGKLFEYAEGGSEHCVLYNSEVDLIAPVDGTYYISIQGPHSMMAFTNFVLKYAADYDGPDLFEESGDDDNKEQDAVRELQSADVVATAFYGVDGTQIANPAKGAIVIEKSTLSNGAVKTVKRIVR